jgi:hypothetical protein
VTHPFHRLSGQRLRVLGQRRGPLGPEVTVDGGRLGRVLLLAAWTDRQPAGGQGRVTIELLAELAAVIADIDGRHAG